MKLFDIIPQRFFTILSGTKKEIYSDCLFILYSDLKSSTSFGVDREIVVQTLSDYFENLEDVSVFDDEEETLKTSREKANFVVRRLKDCEWIDVEDTTSYRQIVNFRDYSIALLETMKKLLTNEKLEYQGYVYAIYSILFGSEEIQESVILEQVCDNTARLMTGLKTLNSNIKKYIERITQQKTPKEIMDLAFNGYAQDIIDKGYHRLKTSDNVSKFRPRIIERLEELKRSREFIEKAGVQRLEMEGGTGLEEAMDGIVMKLGNVISAFENLDSIIEEIDRKNTQYIRASLARVKYLLNSSRDLTGQITDILKYIVIRVEEEDLDIKFDDLDEIEECFGFYPQSFIDEKSLYTQSEAKPAFNPESLDNQNALSVEEREQRIREAKERNKNRMSRENIDRYVMGFLKDRTVLNASSLPIKDVRDFVKIIYILIYSQSRLVHYRIKRLDNEISINEFTFKDFEIWRK